MVVLRSVLESRSQEGEGEVEIQSLYGVAQRNVGWGRRKGWVCLVGLTFDVARFRLIV